MSVSNVLASKGFMLPPWQAKNQAISAEILILIVQVEFGKITNMEKGELCFVNI
jgi:hypothetical protein